MNSKKATATDRPLAHMQFHTNHMDPNAPLLQMDKDDILEALDTESSPVRWLLKQLTTYDCTKQKIVGIIFDRRTVISEVLWVSREVDRTS